jgi:hypothetical protein
MIRQGPPHLQLVAADGRDVDTACHHVARQFRPLDGLMLDTIESLTLSVLRHLCASLGSRTTLGWERAHDLAESALGLGDGPALVAHLAALLRAIRSERPGHFSYMSADCPVCSQRISDEELAVILLIRAARAGRHKRVPQLTASLAERPEAPRIHAAAAALGGSLAAYTHGIELQVARAGLSSDRCAVFPFQQRPDEPGHAS